jgi:hypothetical protein
MVLYFHSIISHSLAMINRWAASSNIQTFYFSEDFSQPSEGPSVYGGRFSKSTSEREEMLVERKNSMLEMARKWVNNSVISGFHLEG